MFNFSHSIVKIIKANLPGSKQRKLSIASCWKATQCQFLTSGNIVSYQLSIVICVALLTACNTQPQNSQTEIETQVTVRELKPSSINKLIGTTATALANNAVELNSEMTGYYTLHTNPRTGKPFKLGDAVSKGQVIISFENKEYENSTAIESRKLSLEIAEVEQIKQKGLGELGGVTLTELRNTDVRVTNARYDLENANINLGKMKVIAPFDGVIVSLPHYTANTRVNQNSPMVGIMDYSNLFMEINLPESALEFVKPNQPVQITHYTLPYDTLDAVVSELSPAISIETRTFKGKIVINNKQLLIRPGMSVKADIIVDQATEAIIIPKDVIISNRNRKFVYVVDRNTAYMRNIRTGLEDEENVQVIEGLNENENLVIRGHETLRDNSRVKVLR